jgi:hypothetical protein
MPGIFAATVRWTVVMEKPSPSYDDHFRFARELLRHEA